MNFNKTFALVVLSLLASGTAARASSVVCTASFLDYGFTATTDIDGTRVGSSVALVVLKDNQPYQSGNTPVISSDVSLGSHIDYTANDSGGKVVVSTNYDSSASDYTGTMVASSSEGSTPQMRATCKVK